MTEEEIKEAMMELFYEQKQEMIAGIIIMVWNRESLGRYGGFKQFVIDGCTAGCGNLEKVTAIIKRRFPNCDL